MKFKTGDSNQYDNGDGHTYSNEPEDTDYGRESGTKGKASGNTAFLKVIILIMAIILVVFIVHAMVVCPSRGECNKLVNNLQTSCNELSMLGVADCMNPTIRALIYGLTGVGMIADDVMSQVLNLICGDLVSETEETGIQISDFFERLTIKPIKYGFPARERAVICRVSFAGLTQNVRLIIVKKNREVYIEKMEMIK